MIDIINKFSCEMATVSVIQLTSRAAIKCTARNLWGAVNICIY